MNDSLIPPDNGRVEECTGNNSSLTCKLVCDKGYLFQNTANSTSYSCINGAWETKFPVLPCISMYSLILSINFSVPFTDILVPYWNPTSAIRRTYITNTNLWVGFDVSMDTSI